MPVYNSAPFLRESIESVLNQSFRDFELIAVDDGSTDQSWEILQSFDHDSRVRSKRRETNQGEAMARNDGIVRSDSEYIAFLDSDDLAKPRRLELQVQAIERGRRFDIVFGPAAILSEGRRVSVSLGRLSSEEVPSLLLFIVMPLMLRAGLGFWASLGAGCAATSLVFMTQVHAAYPILAYGDDGAGPIPPGSVLKFKIELLAINPPDAGGGR